MPTLLDLSHTISPDMPRFAGLDAPRIGALWTHQQAAERGYRDTTCQVSQVSFVTSVGTYLDAPFHFDPDGADVSQLDLSQLVLPGLVLDLREWAVPDAPLPLEALHRVDARGKALLLCTGWSQHWGDEAYYCYPFVPRAMAELLRDIRPALVGIDTLVIEQHADPTRPVHTLLLRSGTLIVENLTGLEGLLEKEFTFVAAPVKVAGAATFPVRAFAILSQVSSGV